MSYSPLGNILCKQSIPLMQDEFGQLQYHKNIHKKTRNSLNDLLIIINKFEEKQIKINFQVGRVVSQQQKLIQQFQSQIRQWDQYIQKFNQHHYKTSLSSFKSQEQSTSLQNKINSLRNKLKLITNTGVKMQQLNQVYQKLKTTYQLQRPISKSRLNAIQERQKIARNVDYNLTYISDKLQDLSIEHPHCPYAYDMFGIFPRLFIRSSSKYSSEKLKLINIQKVLNGLSKKDLLITIVMRKMQRQSLVKTQLAEILALLQTSRLKVIQIFDSYFPKQLIEQHHIKQIFQMMNLSLEDIKNCSNEQLTIYQKKCMGLIEFNQRFIQAQQEGIQFGDFNTLSTHIWPNIFQEYKQQEKQTKKALQNQVQYSLKKLQEQKQRRKNRQEKWQYFNKRSKQEKKIQSKITYFDQHPYQKTEQ